MAENYRALTRKYRPHSFEDIVSQEHVSNTLLNAIKQNRISHSYMFCGPRGVGKTTMARVLARTINNVDASVDGEHLNQTLNIVEIDAASNNKVDDVHHLRENVRIPPQNGRYKIFIIDEVHMLSKQAFNALLKTLEEPPEHAIFIFATTEPHKVLPTILSRVQRFDFKRISVDEIVSRLKDISQKESINIDDESLHVIAKKADGALRDALGLMDQAIAFCGDTIRYKELLTALNVVDKDHLFDFTDAVQQRDAQKGLLLIDELLQAGTDIQEFLVTLTEHLRNMYVAKNSKNMYLVEATAETKEMYRVAAASLNEEDLMRMMHMVTEAQVKLKDARQPRVQFEILLLKLIHMSRAEELAVLLNELESVKKNGLNQVNNPPSEVQKKSESPSTPQPDVKELIIEEPEEGEESVPVQNEAVKEPDFEEEEPAEVTVSGSETEEDDLFGPPSIPDQNGTNGKANGSSLSSHYSETVTEVRTQTVEIKKITLDDIQAAWPGFLIKLKETCGDVLYLQIERLKVKSLQGLELYLSADNEFAVKIVEENKMTISGVLKECTGCHVQIKCVKERDREVDESSLDPYEKFKEIQQRDPAIKKMVELFGAELEY
jgi:DNA polymerase-3 subunit gamma/tau